MTKLDTTISTTTKMAMDGSISPESMPLVIQTSATSARAIITDPDPERVLRAVSAEERGTGAAEHLARKSRKHEENAEQDKPGIEAEAGRVNGQDNIRKEHRRENEIAHHVGTLFDVSVILVAREHQSRDICARDVRHAEPFFAGIREKGSRRQG